MIVMMSIGQDVRIGWDGNGGVEADDDVFHFAISWYALPKDALQGAKEYAQWALEDDASSYTFDASMQEFDTTFADAFDDIVNWVHLGNNGDQQTIETTTTHLGHVANMVTAFGAAVQRWSSDAVQGRKEALVELVSNLIGLLHVSNHIMAESLHAMVLGPLAKLIHPCPEPTQPASSQTTAVAKATPTPCGAVPVSMLASANLKNQDSSLS